MSRTLLLLLTAVFTLTACQKNDQPDVPATTGDTATDTADEGTAEALESTDEFQAKAADFGPRDQMPGATLYAEHCAGCHNGTVPKAPHLVWLEMMDPATLLTVMNDGIMQTQSAQLDVTQKRDLVQYLTLQPWDSAGSARAYAPACGSDTALDAARTPPAVGWGHDTDRFSPAEVAGLTAADAPDLKLKWAYAFPGALRARSNPSVGFGAIFVGSQDGSVYALDLESGCAHWRFTAGGEVRTGVVLRPAVGDAPPLALFGDILARVYALNALTGELLWSLKVDDHPSATVTGTPALHEDLLLVPVSSLEVTAAADPNYACCTFRGKLLALNAVNGSEVWTHYTIPSPPREVARTRVGTAVMAPSGAPTWASPAVDAKRNRVYIGTGENYSSPADGNSDAILAIDLSSGERVWTRQSTAGDAWNVACMMEDNPNCPEEDGPDFDHGSPMILVDTGDGGEVLVAGHKDGTIFGLDPDAEGALLWATRVGRGSIQGGVHFGLAAGEGVVYAPINDMNDTRTGDVLDPELARPGVHGIRAADGKLLWSHVQTNVCPADRPFCDPGVSAPVSAFPGAVVAGHLDAFVRIYARDTGEVLWEYDTAQPVTGVNGMEARGGGMSGAGPIVVDGHLILNSGYGLYFHSPGNMLAVFAPAKVP
ncbi:MAG: PQQ-binding-like beta-propeller repeat protein [Pseudomonadota bacterium]